MPTKPRKISVKEELVFDATARKQFLTGFQKRKSERKLKAKTEADKIFKEEITKIKQRKREDLQKRIEEVAQIRAEEFGLLSSLNNNNQKDVVIKPKVIDMQSHTVTVTSAEEIDLSKNKDTYFLGANSTDVEVIELNGTNSNNEEDENNKEKQPARISNREKRRTKTKITELTRRKGLFSKNKGKNIIQGKAQKSVKKYMRKKQKHKNRLSRKLNKT